MGVKRILSKTGIEVRHGTPTAYKTHNCRCDVCRKSNTEYVAKLRAKQREIGRNDPSRIPHGTFSGYANWACRCDLCKPFGNRKNRNKTEPTGFNPATYFKDSDALLESLAQSERN